MPAYEDAWYYLWKERRLPTNVDPFDSKLENEEDRKRLAKIFEQGLGQGHRPRVAVATRRGWGGLPGKAGPGSCAPNACI
jgi:uncharacterized protein (DUF2126 family)